MSRRKDPIQREIDLYEIEILNRMEKRGLTAYRRSLLSAVSCLVAALLVALIALLGSLNVVFYAFAAILMFAAIRYWLNMRDMERFIDTTRQKLIEIQK